MLLKQLKSLKNSVHAGDRAKFIVSSWNNINAYASQMSGEDELIKKTNNGLQMLDEAFSSEEDDNLVQPLEIEEE